MEWLVAFLLISPEISIDIGFFSVDGYIFLLLILMASFLRKGRFRLNGPLLILLYIFFIWVFLMIAQSVLAERYVFNSHLTPQNFECRQSITYGDTSCVSKLLFSQDKIRVLIYLIFSFLLSIYLSWKDASGAIRLFKKVIYASVIFQIFLVLIYTIGFYDVFSRLLMSGTGSEVTSNVHHRFGMPRFSSGFSEPSFLASINFVCLCCMVILTYKREAKLLKKDKIGVLVSLLFLSASTLSIMVIFNFMFFLLYLVCDRKARFYVGFFSFSVFLVVLLLSTLRFVIDADVFRGGLESVIVRQYMVTPLSSLSIESLFFGYGLGEVYNFVVFNNLVMQIGIFGVLLLLLVFFIVGPEYKLSFLFLIVFLSVTPSLQYSFFYIAVAFMFSACDLSGQSGVRSGPLVSG